MTNRVGGQLNGYRYDALVTRVVDGDTADITVLLLHDADLGFGLTPITWPYQLKRCRFARINAPEMNTPEGPAARDYLTGLLGGTPSAVTVVTTKDKQDNYGRILVEIYKDGVSVNQAMLDSGHAVPYKE